MNTKIGNIATIHSGIYAKPEYQGDVYYIQARHYNSHREFVTGATPELTLDGKIAHHLLQPGDILVAAKGNNNFAVEWGGAVAPAVASSMFIIIRIKDFKKITAGFITWYLNLPISQTYFQNNAKGSAMVSLTKDVIQNMEIPMPTIKQQVAIAKLYALQKTEKQLNKQLNDLKETHLQQRILNAIQ